MDQSTEKLTVVIQEAIASTLAADPGLLAGWGPTFDTALQSVLREAGRRALSVALSATDEALSAAAREDGWRVERRPVVEVMTVLGAVSTRSTYLCHSSKKGSGLRPMLEQFGIRGKRCTRGLERALVDFGAERSFEKASAAVQEHYGFDVASTTLRNVTLSHASTFTEWLRQHYEQSEPAEPAHEAETVVAGLDGCALRVIEGRVRTDDVVDGERVVRERVKLAWVDTRTAFVRKHGAVTRYCYSAASSFGEVLEPIVAVARRCGRTDTTQVVMLGDGGNGLMEAGLRAFPGAQFILDRMHLRQHIGEVGEFLKIDAALRPAWVDQIDRRIGRGEVGDVIADLKSHIPERRRGQAPPADRVTPFIEYLTRFADCMNYDDYQARGWPIGSGEVESLHRQGPQPRLKIPGASWHRDSLNDMAGLRAGRLSGQWEEYWRTPDAA